jgi:hypothetical protein
MQMVSAVILLLSSQILWAQSPGVQHDPNYSATEAERRFAQESFEKWATEPAVARQAAARREAEAKLREFYAKAQRFVALWKKFTDGMNDQKTFNVKLAKEVSKAFHDLEKSDGWPAGRSK